MGFEGLFKYRQKGVETALQVRGGEHVKATVSSARLKVAAHGVKRFVIALKYEGECPKVRAQERLPLPGGHGYDVAHNGHCPGLHVEVACGGLF
jgi:hypothetical protein